MGVGAVTNLTTLTPADSDATIYAALVASPLAAHQPRSFDGSRWWSRTQDRWLTPAEAADEWRHQYRFRQIVGSPDECAALTDYERVMGWSA